LLHNVLDNDPMTVSRGRGRSWLGRRRLLLSALLAS
jgi:hypothetical protein